MNDRMTWNCKSSIYNLLLCRYIAQVHFLGVAFMFSDRRLPGHEMLEYKVGILQKQIDSVAFLVQHKSSSLSRPWKC